jgi:hypothetical protein
MNLDDLAAAGLHQADPFGDVQRLPVDVAVPGGVRTGREPHDVHPQPRRRLTGGDHVEPHVTGEHLRGALGARLPLLNLHQLLLT